MSKPRIDGRSYYIGYVRCLDTVERKEQEIAALVVALKAATSDHNNGCECLPCETLRKRKKH